jgi:hypothetical protein
MSKTTRPSSSRSKSMTRDWPVVVYMWAFGLGIAGYIIARILLDGQPHPWHWASGLAGGLIGVGLGWLWFRWKGDVI